MKTSAVAYKDHPMPADLNTEQHQGECRSIIRGWTIAFLLLFLPLVTLAHNPLAAHAQNHSDGLIPVKPNRILVLCSYGYALPAYQKLNPAFLSVMEKAGVSTNALFFEYLDLLHIKDKEHSQALADMLRHKYAGIDIDLIVTLHAPAMSFLLDEAKDFFPQIPIISWNVQEAFEEEDKEHRIFPLMISLDVQGTLERMVELFPQTQRVVLISGVSLMDRQTEAQAKAVFANWETKLQFEYTSHYSVEEILKRVASLPPHSIVLYCNLFQDKTGRTFTPRDVGEMVARTANAPVFGLYDTLLGSGVVGGSLLSFEAEGVRAADLALDILHGKISHTEQATALAGKPVSMFDWQQLEKWGGKVGNLAQGSIFINRSPSLWDRYAWQLIGFLGLLLGQLFLIATLMIQRRHRARAEAELKQINATLEQRVAVRTAELHESEQRVRRKLESVLAPEGDPGALELIDLMDTPALQQLMDDFYAVARIPVSILDVKGRVLVGVGWQDICTRFHRVQPDTCRHCLESDTQLAAGLAQGECRLYKCKNHLWDMATPIIVADQHLGNIFTGQFFFEDEQIDRALFRAQSREYGFDEEQYLSALDRVPRLSRETVDRGMAFFIKLAGTLSQLGYSNVKLAHLLAERDRLNDSLRESRAKLEAALASMTDAVFISDAQGRFLDFNDAFATFHRFRSKEDCSKTFAEYPDLLEVFMANGEPAPLDQWAVPRALRGETVTNAEYRLRRKDTGETWVGSYSFGPIRAKDGLIVGSVVVGRDITELKRAAAELEWTARQRRLALDASRMGWWHYDPLTRIASWDDRYQEIFGVTGYSHPNDEILTRLHPEDLPGVRAKVEEALDPVNPQPYLAEYRINLPEGSMKWIEAYGIASFEGVGANRRATSFVGTVADITERKLAQETLRTTVQRFHRILSNIFAGILVVTEDDRIEFVNQNFCDQFELAEAPSELIGLAAKEMLLKVLPAYADPAANLVRIQQILAQRQRIEDEEVLMRNGRVLLRDHIPNLVDGEPRGRMWQHRDITGRKQMEEALRRAHDELELRVRERTAELSATIARLELINQELQEFAHVASHDLQEPLRKIQTFCDLAKKRCAPVLDTASQEYLDKVLSSADRMRQLLRDLLVFSRVATQPQPFSTVDLGGLAREAADVFEATVKETGCQIEIENLPAIEADETQMLRLFQNLIGNALKFRSGETPRIKIYGKFDSQGAWEIFVHDNGIGFEQQYAELIFKPFQRLHRRSEYDGTGIGLAICRKIVERHGGNIRAESAPGKGSTFIIRLPVKPIDWENIVSAGQSS